MLEEKADSNLWSAKSPKRGQSLHHLFYKRNCIAHDLKWYFSHSICYVLITTTGLRECLFPLIIQISQENCQRKQYKLMASLTIDTILCILPNSFCINLLILLLCFATVSGCQFFEPDIRQYIQYLELNYWLGFEMIQQKQQ